MLALVSAMAQELDALRPLLEAPVTVAVGGRRFETGLLHGEPVVLVLTGIGKVAAAATTVQLIERFGATRLVFTGVAGGLGEGVRVGDLVIGDELLQHDMDASPLFPRHEVPLLGLSRFPADAALSMELARAAVEVAADPARHFGREAADLGVSVPRVHRGLIVSGDRFVATAAESRRLQAELPDALAVDGRRRRGPGVPRLRPALRGAAHRLGPRRRRRARRLQPLHRGRGAPRHRRGDRHLAGRALSRSAEPDAGPAPCRAPVAPLRGAPR